MINKPALVRNEWLPILFGLLAVGVGAVASLVVVNVPSNMLLMALVIAPFIALGMTRKPEWGLLLLVFMTYIRLSDVLVEYHGVPSIAKPFIVLLIVIIAARWLLYGEEPRGWYQSALIVIGYGLIGFTSLLYADDKSIVQGALVDHVKDAIIAVVITMLIHKAVTLHRVVWMLLLAGIFMGTLSVYQQMTGTFDNIYWGFAQAEIKNIVGETSDYRIGGPGFGPNAYGQFLVVLVPIALDRLWSERKLGLRILAGWSLGVVVLSIFFTFSRGSFLGLLLVLGAMIIHRPPKVTTLLVTLLMAMFLVQMMPAQYTDRLKTLFDLLPGSDTNALDEISFRGRISENTVGWRMFTDHPLIGVGLANYKANYLSYSEDLGIDARREERGAHNMYLQIAAESGLMGLFAMGLIMWVLYRAVRAAVADFEQAGMPDYANLAFAFGVSLLGFFAVAVVKHMAHPRYFWMLCGIALSMPYVARQELQARLADNSRKITNAVMLGAEKYDQ
ncbi:MAG: O-antigen ligase family protein [Anaerolineae bacterium]|nr:O-antigen ligase family protein [Anaerolineae bacterium]